MPDSVGGGPTERAAVTGAGGFFARALEAKLAGRVKLRGLFRSPAGRADAWRARDHGVVIGDLEDDSALEDLVRGVDVVYHLAARRGKDDLEASRRTNVAGTEAVARAAARAGVRRFVYVSSISVYAETTTPDGTIREDVEPLGIDRLNPYSRTKYEGEVALRRLAESGHAPPFTIVRPTNVYGPWGRAWFLDWVRRLRRLPVVMGGNVTIDLVHVDDVAEGIIRAGAAPDAVGEVLHLSHHEILLGDFAERVGAAVGVRVRHLPAPVDLMVRAAVERGHRVLHGSRRSTPLLGRRRYPHDHASTVSGYAPGVSLDEGFRQLALWYAEQAS
jgi:UDP-N-acetyl-alpha-D-quinovosamine dehydrogenase